MAPTKVAPDQRISFGKIEHLAETPDLLGIQIQSFKDFFQLETTPDKRNVEGLFRVFKENFPITDTRNIFMLEFLDYFVDPPRYTIEECIERGLTYAVPLKAKLRLSCNDEEHVDFQTIVQDVFLSAWTKAHTYRGDAPLWNWLTIITVNRCRTHLRRKAMLSRLTAGLMGRSEEFSPASDANSLAEESNQRVRAAMARLPSRDREVVVLLYLEHRRPAEIATLLEISVNAVNVRLHRARQKLKVLLEDVDGEMS